jgi:hypothetical protein
MHERTKSWMSWHLSLTPENERLPSVFFWREQCIPLHEVGIFVSKDPTQFQPSFFHDVNVKDAIGVHLDLLLLDK